jgi:hypothetical protein
MAVFCAYLAANLYIIGGMRGGAAIDSGADGSGCAGLAGGAGEGVSVVEPCDSAAGDAGGGEKMVARFDWAGCGLRSF